MARLPYADPAAPEAKPLVERIVAQRGSLMHLYQMLIHSPPLAEGWLTYLTAVRQRCALSGAIRELVIVRVAVLNGAQYEAEQHAPIALREGVSARQLGGLADWQQEDVYAPNQRAALALTDAMTLHVHVPDPVFAEVRRHFDDRETVELVATIAAYNMVSRFLEALGIQSDDERRPG